MCECERAGRLILHPDCCPAYSKPQRPSDMFIEVYNVECITNHLSSISTKNNIMNEAEHAETFPFERLPLELQRHVLTYVLPQSQSIKFRWGPYPEEPNYKPKWIIETRPIGAVLPWENHHERETNGSQHISDRLSDYAALIRVKTLAQEAKGKLRIHEWGPQSQNTNSSSSLPPTYSTQPSPPSSNPNPHKPSSSTPTKSPSSSPLHNTPPNCTSVLSNCIPAASTYTHCVI